MTARGIIRLTLEKQSGPEELDLSQIMEFVDLAATVGLAGSSATEASRNAITVSAFQDMLLPSANSRRDDIAELDAGVVALEDDVLYAPMPGLADAVSRAEAAESALAAATVQISSLSAERDVLAANLEERPEKERVLVGDAPQVQAIDALLLAIKAHQFHSHHGRMKDDSDQILYNTALRVSRELDPEYQPETT